MGPYVMLKWFHVLMAITALGANITYGVWFSLAARDPQHLAFALRGIRVLDNRVANPAYGLLLITGFAMAGMGKISFRTPWLLTSLILYVILVVIAAAGYTPTLRRQIQALDAAGPNSPEYQRLAVLAVIIVFVMVTKPWS
jgi:uncharacterized membrane protein